MAKNKLPIEELPEGVPTWLAYNLGEINTHLSSMSAALAHLTARWDTIDDWRLEVEGRLQRGSENFTNLRSQLAALEERACKDIEEVKDALAIANKPSKFVNGHPITFKWLVEKSVMPVVVGVIMLLIGYAWGIR